MTKKLFDGKIRFSAPHKPPRISAYSGLVTVSNRLGHASVNTTETFYSHMIDKRKAQAAECIANVMLRRKA